MSEPSQKYIDEQLAKGLAGYKKMKAACEKSPDAMAAFGNLNIQVYEDMIVEEEKAAKNKKEKI